MDAAKKAPVSGPAEKPPAETPVCVEVVFENACEGGVELLWVRGTSDGGDDTDNLVSYGSLRAVGERRVQATYTGHRWRARQIATGEVVAGMYTAAAVAPAAEHADANLRERVAISAGGFRVCVMQQPRWKPCGKRYVEVDIAGYSGDGLPAAVSAAAPTGLPTKKGKGTGAAGCMSCCSRPPPAAGTAPPPKLSEAPPPATGPTARGHSWPRIMVESTVLEDSRSGGSAGANPTAPATRREHEDFFQALAADISEIRKVLLNMRPGGYLLANTTVYVNDAYSYDVMEPVEAGAGAAVEIDTTGTGDIPPGVPPSSMCVHWSKAWLETHGNLPEKEGCVEVASMASYLRARAVQPSQLLHEMAHVLHYLMEHRAQEQPSATAGCTCVRDAASWPSIVAFDAELPPPAQLDLITSAYTSAKARGAYEAVDHICGGAKQRHYALTNDREYFAESTEAFLSTGTLRNDFYPFNRDQLREFDPTGYMCLQTIWEPLEVLPAAAPVKRVVCEAPPAETHVVFANATDDAMRVLWVSFDGGEKEYAVVEPGGEHRQHTYVGHRWVVRGVGTGECFTTCEGAAEEERVVVLAKHAVA